MLSSGWSTLKVAVIQLLSGATAFIGLYIAIAVSQVSSEAQQWIFIVAAGMFLYVALADVVRTTFDWVIEGTEVMITHILSLWIFGDFGLQHKSISFTRWRHGAIVMRFR